MPVSLDNIQFYHGPSRPAKRPYFAFNSNGSASSTLPSSEQAAFSYEPDSSVTDDSTMIPNCSLPPSVNAEDSTYPNAVRSLNLFDIELANSWEEPMPLLNTWDSGGGNACHSLQKFDCDHQESPDEKMPGDMSLPLGVSSRRSREFGDSSLSLRSPALGTSPPPPPESYSIAELSPGSAISAREIMQSRALEDTQEEQNQPSRRAYTNSSSPADTWDIPDAASSERSLNVPLSSISSCSDVASKLPNDKSPRASSPEDCSHDNEGADKSRLVSDCYPGTVAVSGSASLVNRPHVNIPGLMDGEHVEQATRHKSASSHLRTPNSQGNKNRSLAISRNYKERKERAVFSTGKQGTAHEESRSSIAVVIPPFQLRPSRTTRSNPKSVPSRIYQSDSSEDFDDSSDEDFRVDAVQSEFSAVEDYQHFGDRRSRVNTAASYRPPDISLDTSAGHRDSRDIVGRAILTIETEGSEPTFFFTLVPDNIRSTSCVATQSLPHKSGKQDRSLKRSVAVGRSARGKGKRQPYSPDEDQLLVKLKEERRLTWEEIADHFPRRTLSALQVHYSTKLRRQTAKKNYLRSQKGVGK